MKSKMFFGLLVLVIAMSGTAQALWWEAGAAEWQDNSWTSTDMDDVYLGSPIQAVCTVTTAGNIANNVTMGAYAVGGGTFEVSAGSLEFWEFRMDSRNIANPDTLILSGGTVTNNVGIQLWANDASLMQIVGGGVTMAGEGVVGNFGIVEWVIDGTGASTMPWQMQMNLGSAVIRLTSDGAAPGVYDLLDGALGNPGNVNWQFDNPAQWDVSNFVTDGTVTLIPEPATMMLLGLGGLLLRRKK